MKGGAHILADRSVVGFHSLADPVEHDADKTVLIEISDKIFLRLSDGCPDGLFFDNTHDQIVGQAEDGFVVPEGVVGVQADRGDAHGRSNSRSCVKSEPRRPMAGRIANSASRYGAD